MRRMPFNAEDIEKFVFISYNFVFSGDEKLEIPLVGDYQNNIYYKMFLKYQLGSIQNVPALIFDESTGVYIGLINDPTDNTFYLVNGRTSQVVDIQMYIENNILNVNITHTTEELLSEDYIKTIFGQNIAGTGDITMYRHQLEVEMQDSTRKIYIELNSSNKDPINTLQQFSIATNAKEGMIFSGTCDDTANIVSARIYYEENTWKGAIAEDFGMIVLLFKDIVTPIR